MIISDIEYLPNGKVQKTCIFDKDPYHMEFMTAVISYFLRNPSPDVVSISNFKNPKKIMYSYEMDRLNSLSHQEEEFLDWIGEVYDLKGHVRALAQLELPHFNINIELITLLKKVIISGRYTDIHSGNIMIDNDGRYVIIDLEGFSQPPLFDPKNDWIKNEGDIFRSGRSS